MWPLTKAAKEDPVYESSPCGNDREHHFWTKTQGWNCPMCSGIAERKLKAAKEEELLERLASKIAAKLLRK